MAGLSPASGFENVSVRKERPEVLRYRAGDPTSRSQGTKKLRRQDEVQ